MKSIRLVLVIISLMLGVSVKAQDTVAIKSEIGVAVNRYLPELDNEFRPYFFSLEYRYNWITTEKIKHLATLRLSGNINNNITTEPETDKIYAAAEVGYRGRQIRDGKKWFLSYGVHLGVFFTRENLLFEDSEQIEVVEPFTIQRDYYRFGLSPNFGFGYYFNELTFIEVIMSIGFTTESYGNVNHLDNNNWRGFSAQMPSVGIYRRF